MSFPDESVSEGTLYTNKSGITYRKVGKTWVAEKQGLSPIKYSIGYDEPNSPIVGEFWLNNSLNTLNIYVYDGDNYYWKQIDNSPIILIEEPDDPKPGALWYNPLIKTLYYYIVFNGNGSWEVLASLEDNDSKAILSSVLPLSWLYSKERMNFELFSPTSLAYKWRDIEPIEITQTNANDDTVDLVTTDGLKEGSSYVIYTAAGGVIETPVINTILTPTRIRLVTDLTHNLNAMDGAYLARSSFAISDSKAVVKNGDILFSYPLNALEYWNGGQLAIRRSVNGYGSFDVRYRAVGDTTWILSDVDHTLIVDGNEWRDEFHDIPASKSILEIKVEFVGIDNTTTETIKHMVLFCKQLSEDLLRMERPQNIDPENNETGITITPTLTGSPFRHLYDVEQNGAEFQIATDPAFSNLVINTSTAYLASWVKVAGQTANFKGMAWYGDRKFVGVGDTGAVLYSSDGGTTWTAGTFGSSAALKDVAWNGNTDATSKFLAVGASGTISSSSDVAAWNAQTQAGSFSGTFNGVAFRNLLAIAVGTSGEIQRSTNGGVIWAKMTQANSYSGTFNAITMLSSGRAIAVGNTGEIQTTPNGGLNWVKRTQAGGYNSNFTCVAMNEEGYAIIGGETGEVQVSSDFGASWTKVTLTDTYAGTFRGVHIRDNVAILVGDSGQIQSSYDKGLHWTKRPTAASETGNLLAVASSDDDYFTLIMGTGGIIQKSFRLEGEIGNTYTVPEGSDLLELNGVYWWRCRYKDTVGFWSEWSKPTVFATSPIAEVIRYVKQPQNLSPADGMLNVPLTPTLQSTAFAYEGPEETHEKSQWQISTSTDFTTPVYNSGDVDDLLVHNVPSSAGLHTATFYFWRVRHKGLDTGYGAWSVPTQFKASEIPNTPLIISPADNTSNLSTVITVTSSTFSSTATGEIHIKSQWQISKASDFSTFVFDSGETNKLTSMDIASGILMPLTQYYFRVRYKGQQTGWSLWSTAVKALTGGVPTTPTILTPANNSIDQDKNPVLTSSDFNPMISNELHVKSEWQVSTVSNFGSVVYTSGESNDLTSHTVGTALNWITTYYVRVRYKGSITGWSLWSAVSKFETSYLPGDTDFTTPGDDTFTVPAGVTSISAVTIGGGANGTASSGGGGGALQYKNNIPVTPGEILKIHVATAGDTVATSILRSDNSVLLKAGTAVGNVKGQGYGYSGGDGGAGGSYSAGYGGGGGAAGRYTKAGGDGAYYKSTTVNNPDVYVPGVTSKSWKQTGHSVTSVPASGPPSSSSNTYISGSTSTSQGAGATYTKTRTWQTALTAGGANDHWNNAEYTTYTLVETVVSSGYWQSGGTSTVKSTVAATGTLGSGRGGDASKIGEGALITGKDLAGTYGAGGPVNGSGQQGAIRIIWGPNRTYPNNAA